MFLKLSQNLLGNICAGDPFLHIYKTKNQTPTKVFSYDFCEKFKNTFMRNTSGRSPPCLDRAIPISKICIKRYCLLTSRSPSRCLANSAFHPSEIGKWVPDTPGANFRSSTMRVAPIGQYWWYDLLLSTYHLDIENFWFQNHIISWH